MSVESNAQLCQFVVFLLFCEALVLRLFVEESNYLLLETSFFEFEQKDLLVVVFQVGLSEVENNRLEMTSKLLLTSRFWIMSLSSVLPLRNGVPL